VVFCDLVGSTALSRRLDPEDYAEVLRAYQECCAELVHRHGGRVARVIGDGLLIYFGYPAAHEDDPQRAVLAGAELVDAVRRLRPEIRATQEEIRLAVRIGIHTGRAVVGEMGRGDTWDPMASVGDTPNVAARVQAEADPNTVMISEATRRLLRDRVATQPAGMRWLKGLPEPIALHRIAADLAPERGSASPPPAAPLVGREGELGLLLERWARSRAGHGGIVLLVGEAGIGKSRLVQGLKEQASPGPHYCWESRCSSHSRHSAFFPFIEMVERALDLRRGDPPSENLNKLERALAPFGVAERLAPLLATFLALPPAERHATEPMGRERQRRASMEAVVSLALAVAARQPLLLIVEDLHWADPSTLALLTMLIERTPSAALLAVFTLRPDFDPPWPAGGSIERLTLKGLPPEPVARMATSIAMGRQLPEAVIEQIVARTDGVPLFVEELTRMLIDSGALTERADRYELSEPAVVPAIPSTLRDLLSARLDRLSAAKPVAQLGAVIGREFTYRLLLAVSAFDDIELQEALDRLVRSGLVYQSGSPPEAVYRFKHHLVQEAAYDSLLRRRRRDYHHRIASVLDERFADVVATRPELLAHHYTAAEVYDTAVGYWQRAGEQALERSAAVEAAAHMRQGLALIARLPQATTRTEAEVMLLIGLGAALTATRGYGAEEVARTYARARDLCEELGETGQLFPALRGLQSFYMVHGPLDVAQKLGEQLLRDASRGQDPVRIVEAARRFGWCLFCAGHIAEGRRHLEEAIGRYDRARSREHTVVYGSDPAVVARANLGWLEWFAGRPERAVELSARAVLLARELKHPLSLAYALCMSAAVHQCRGEAATARALARETVVLADENAFAYWKAWGLVLEGWALAAAGESDPGLARLREGLDAYRATGAELFRAHALSLEAEIYAQTGRLADALGRLDEALASIETNSVLFLKADVLRRKGAVLRALGDCSAEECFGDALALAHEQGALSLELKAAVCLAERDDGQGRAGVRELAAAYGRFLEGFDTADLREARALLERQPAQITPL
jgi:class 3 adenylate cyclase/predicted ATPase